MDTERKYQPKKEGRGWYFVEYHPPSAFKFAILQLTLTIEISKSKDVKDAMEKEASLWLRKFPVPLMVTTFDNKENRYYIDEIKEKSNLMAFYNEKEEIKFFWGILKDEDIPNNALDKEYVRNLYSDFSYTTSFQDAINRDKKRRQIENGFVLFLLLPFISTVLYEAFLYFNDLFSLVAFIFVLYKAVKKSLVFVGIWPKTKKAREIEQEERLKEHYYYYCKMNPEGFERLKTESLQRMAQDRVQGEFQEIKSKQ